MSKQVNPKRATILELARDGKSNNEIAKTVGERSLYVADVIYVARKRGELQPKEAVDKELLGRILHLLGEEGLSQRKAAETLNMGRMPMMHVVKKAVELGIIPKRPNDIEKKKPKPPSERKLVFIQIVREPQPRIKITREIRAQIIHLYHQEHHNATAVSQATGADIGDVVEIVREERLALLA